MLVRSCREPIRLAASAINELRSRRMNPGATLDHLREAVNTLEEIERIARRVFGGAHLLTMKIEAELQKSRAALRARETPPPPSINT